MIDIQSYTIHKYNPYLPSLLNIVLNTYLHIQLIVSHGSSLIFINIMYLPVCAFAVLGTFRYRWYGWWCTNRVLVGIVKIQEIIAEFHIHFSPRPRIPKPQDKIPTGEPQCRSSDQKGLSSDWIRTRIINNQY